MSTPAYARFVQNPAAAMPLRRPIAVTGLGIQGWLPFAFAATAAAIASVLFSGWIAFHWVSDQATIDVEDVGEAVAAFAAALSCGLAASRNTGRTRVAWLFFAASTFSWGAGEVIWCAYQIGLGVAVPFPSAADLGFLLAVPLAIFGVFAFTSSPQRLATRGQTVLSGAIVGLSLLFIAWQVGLGKVYDTSSQAVAGKVIGLAYPVGDIITATVLVVALQRARRGDVGRLALLLGGLAFTALANSAFAYLTANGTYGALGSVLDSGWVIGFLLIALAPLWPGAAGRVETAEGPIQLWQLALPWLAVLVGAMTVIARAATGSTLDLFATALAGGLGVLFVASHVLSHRDSVELLHKSRLSEAQVERRSRLLDEILAHAPLGIARASVDTTIIDVNPRLAALLRTTPEKMIGTPVAKYLHPDEFERVYEEFQPLWKGAVDTVESDSRAIRADGTEVWLHWSATGVRNSQGRIAYFLVMYEDTDAEHAANEAAAAHLAGLERLNQLKSEFVSLVSHEFRTALVGITGFSEMIRDEDVTLDEAKAYAGDINTESERLNRMINDMLDLDRIEAGRLTLHIESVDINELLQAAADRSRAVATNHTVTCKFDGEPLVRCDPDRIAQVAANLLGNAVKYSPDGGAIEITTRLAGDEIHVSVRDHGIGIAPEFMKKLFSRYERYEKTSGKILGTGLGLALAKQIVELHGGNISATSEPGEGSDFHFTLPVNGPKIG
ncbi:MAG TPA: PAS domain-containing sensor histidine kinase [Candidatus Dormibacteraeota bacterium]|nr:PAS domain-containing sensor histidine kinase [Candidatus Dormibacteraeota bacterium]